MKHNHFSDELYVDYKLLHKMQAALNQRADRDQLKGLLKCQTHVMKMHGYHFVDVAVRRGGAAGLRAGYINLYSCHSAWACPKCAAYRLMRYRERIEAAINHYKDRCYIAMVTYTVPHERRESLQTVFQRLNACRKAINGAKCFKFSVGCVTSVEVTYNDIYGWHPHTHVIYFIPKADWHKVESEYEHTRRAWRAKLNRLGYTDDDNLNRQCCHLSRTKRGAPRKITSADYITKEIAKLRTGNHGKFKSRTPFQLLDSDDPHDIELFFEYARVTQGHSRICSSANLYKGVDFTQKKTADTSTEAYTETAICSFAASDWNDIIADEFLTGTRHRRRILICAAAGGLFRVRLYCYEHGLPMPYPPQRQLKYAERCECAA